MKVKTIFLFSIISSMLAGTTASAADFEDTARVVSSVAVYERVNTPRQQCWTETVSSTGTVTRSVPEERSIGGAILGGVVGGVVGNQVGQGNGNTAATAAGAIAGAIIGDRVANRDNGSRTETTEVPRTREERRCRQIDDYHDVIRGYDVTYLYNGHQARVRLPNQPGDTVRVAVGIVGEAVSDTRDTTIIYDERDRVRKGPRGREIYR